MKTSKRVHLFVFEYEPQFSDGRIVRIKALANYLVSKGVCVYLYSLSDIQRTQIKNGLTHVEIKYPGMGMVRVGSAEKSNANKSASVLRRGILIIGKLLFPDRYVFSIPSVLWLLRRQVREGDTLIVSLPWFSALLLSILPVFSSRKASLIFDYRDLWVNNVIFVKGRLQQLFASWLETAALNRCDAVTVTTSPAAKYFENKCIKTILISNGISQSDLLEIVAIKENIAVNPRANDGLLLVGYFGNLGNKRECAALLQGLIKAGIELSIYGTVDSSHLSICRKYYFGSVDRQFGLARAAECDFLLIVIRKDENSDFAIPGKVYECVVLRKPILIYCPPDAIVLSYLRDISYPHFHINSEYMADLSMNLSNFVLYANTFDKALLTCNYTVPIREQEFAKLEEYFI